MPGCSAIGCSNSAKKGFLMKRFPSDPKRRKEWAIKLKRDNWLPTVSARLCEICILSLILLRSVHTQRYGLPFDLSQPIQDSEMEDEIEYAPLDGEIPDYDWSPPKNELPETDHKTADALNDFFDDDRESWIDQDNSLGVDGAKLELKRAFDFPRKKKNQVLCRVQRAIHHHSEVGHEFFPKSYTSYSCHPVSPGQMAESSATSHDTCYVNGNNCITIEKEQLFLKRRHNTNCWNHFIEAVGAGCKCLSRKHYI